MPNERFQGATKLGYRGDAIAQMDWCVGKVLGTLERLKLAENTMVIFPGGTFLPVGENGHVFWQTPINATFIASQTMRVPSSVSNGVQSLQVNLSANDFSGAHYEFPQTLAVEVIGASSGSGAPTGKPGVLI